MRGSSHDRVLLVWHDAEYCSQIQGLPADIHLAQGSITSLKHDLGLRVEQVVMQRRLTLNFKIMASDVSRQRYLSSFAIFTALQFLNITHFVKSSSFATKRDILQDPGRKFTLTLLNFLYIFALINYFLLIKVLQVTKSQTQYDEQLMH